MTVLTRRVVPARCEGDKGVLGFAAKDFRAFHFQAQPGALQAPLADGLPVEPGFLHRQGGVQQVIDQAQHIRAVA